MIQREDIRTAILENVVHVRALVKLTDQLKQELNKDKPNKTNVDKLVKKIQKQHDKMLGTPAADWACAMARDVLNQLK